MYIICLRAQVKTFISPLIHSMKKRYMKVYIKLLNQAIECLLAGMEISVVSSPLMLNAVKA